MEDRELGFWLDGIPYLWSAGERKYIVHPNSKSLSAFKQRQECEWIEPFFRAISFLSVPRNSEIRVNGNVIEISRERLWILCSSQYPLRDLKVLSYDGTVVENIRAPIIFDEKILKPVRKILENLPANFAPKVHPKEGDRKLVLDVYKESDFPSRKYDSRVRVNNIHWGQMKLALSEIEFLSNFAVSDETIVLYIGGAPGDHISFLSEMFPNVLFVLYDPHAFSINPSPKIVLVNEYFTDETAGVFRGMDFVLISDIRTPRRDIKEFQAIRSFDRLLEAVSSDKDLSDIPNLGNRVAILKQIEKKFDETFEQGIEEDMEKQKEWVKIMRPLHAMLKFRLRWPSERRRFQTYLSGKLVVQAFPKVYSTEQRLWISRPEGSEYPEEEYDLSEMEQRFFYYNTVYRPSKFFHFHEIFGVNFDTLKMYIILSNYLRKTGAEPTNENVLSILYGLETSIKRESNKHQLTRLLSA